MRPEEINDEIASKNVSDLSQKEADKKSQKKEWGKFEFALFISDFLICKRSFQINGYINGSMKTQEFKDKVDEIVKTIDEDLKSKSRIYMWYHNTPEHPEWEPELTTEPLVDEGSFVFKFVIYDNGEEVISKCWDGRYYPPYIRKSVDITNRQVKIVKDERVNIYDKDTFFAAHDNQLSGDLYVLRAMISGRDNLVPIIQKHIYEVCSSFDSPYESISDYQTSVEYKNTVVSRDDKGNPVYKEKKKNGAVVFNTFDKPILVPVLEKGPDEPKRYNFNIEQENKKLYSAWGASVADKTRKYMSELYVSPKEKFFKKKEEEAQ